MQKKTIIILSLLSAVFSLIYILFSYYGYMRYFGMYVFSTESYSKNYSKLDKMVDDKKVIISMTTTPSRIKKIGPVIRSLLDQTVRVDSISIVIPYGKDYTIEKDLEKVVSVYRTGKDYGELNCLIPTVMREGESDTLIITVGDDTIYSKDFIEKLLETNQSNTDSIIFNSKDEQVDTKKGSVFKTDIFDEGFLDPPEGVDSNKWINDYIAKNKLKTMRIEAKENYRCI